MLIREILDDLRKWKKRKHHPLIISGLRQVGKTFTAKEFGREAYESTIYVDLRANKSVHSAFNGNFDVDEMLTAITTYCPHSKIIPGKTLIILDEIQDCPDARSSLKYWDIDKRFDVIATGSFLSVKGFRAPYKRGIPVGYEEHIEMFPLSFREFLINIGLSEEVFGSIETSLETLKPVNTAIHERMRYYFKQYLIVGGMPEAVSEFFSSHDVKEVRRIQKRILTSLQSDFGRYKDNNGNECVNESLKLRAEAALSSLPSQLSKEYKKFQYSIVNIKANSKEKAEGIEYLEDVGLVVRAYNTRELSFPLESAKIENEFKAYTLDTGLLMSLLGPEAPKKVLSDELGAYKGAIIENITASSFIFSGRRLYYYHAPSGSPELDFVYEKGEEVIIVECKSTNTRATSMKHVLANPKKYGTHTAVKYADTNVGKGDGFITYPLYALGFLKDEEESLIIPMMETESTDSAVALKDDRRPNKRPSILTTKPTPISFRERNNAT